MAITPRFEADISADISRFMTNMAKVDKKIKDYASGVVIDIQANINDFMSDISTVESTIQDINNSNSTININGDISDLERAIQEANAQIASLNSDSTININGNNSSFNSSANDVNKQTNKLSRRVTEARIGADIGDFESRMVEVMRSLTEADDTVTPRIEADIVDFNRDILEVQDRMREIARTTANPQVEADIAGFMAQMALVQSQLNDVVDTHDVDIHADTASARVRLGLLWAQIRTMTAKDHVIRLRASWANFQEVMGAMAVFSRNIGEIIGMIGRGLIITISPAIVPIIATLVGLLGNLGPMLGTIAGSTFAFATSLGAAGLGAAGFAAVAIPSIKGVIDTAGELKSLEEEIAEADTWEERNKLMKEQSAILDGMSKAQRGAGEALNAFKSNYSALVKDMETPVLNVFATALIAVTSVLDLARPMIENVTASVQKLMDSFNANLEAADVKAFFTFLKDYAGPALEAVVGAIGNFLMGLFNMMAAFGPLSTETQNSFLKMSESFRDWSAGLSNNKGFQKFVSFVSENMPKIRSIFSDAINGVVHMFAAFGDSSSTMMTKLADMMEGFLSWSKSLGESQGFKSFIDYIQTNGPTVVSTIGEIVDFIINLGIAAAPMGEKLLGMVNAFLDFANGLLEAHPWLGKIAIGMVVLGGAFLAAMPILVGLNALTGGFITTLIKLGVQFLLSAAKMAAGWIIAMGPIGWIIITVAALAILIYKYWDEISAWTKKAWTAVSTAVTAAVDKIMAWIQEKFPAVYEIIQSYMTMAKDVLITIWDLIKGTFSNALAWVKALVKGDFEGMSEAVKNQMTLMKDSISKIWDAVKEHLGRVIQIIKDKAIEKFAELGNKVVGKILLLKNQALAKWIELKTKTLQKIDETKTRAVALFNILKDKIREKMVEVVKNVAEKVGEMPGKVTGFVGDMLSAGADLIQGLIDGALGMASDAIGTIKSIAGDMVDAALSFFKIKSPSRVFMEMGAYVSEGLAVGVQNNAKLAVANVASMASAMTNAFNPQMELANMNASATLDTSVSRADMGVVRKSFAAEIKDFEKDEPDLYLVVDGKELGKVVAKPVKEENDRQENIVKIGRGRR